MFCQKCGAEVGESQRFCRSCGMSLSSSTAKSQSKRSRFARVAGWGLVVVFGLLVLYGVSSEHDTQQTSESTISEATSKVEDPATRQLNILINLTAEEVKQ